MKVLRSIIVVMCLIGLVLLGAGIASTQIPLMINQQGLVKVNGFPHEGNGYFKFGFLDGTDRWLWTNDGTHVGETVGNPPDTAVTIPVNKGVYNVRLGDATLANMTAIPSTVFNSDDVKLRIIFDDGTSGEEVLVPDEPVTSAAYCYHAAVADNSNDADTVDGHHAGDIMPSGVIVMWSGAIANIPDGWALCDGTNGTPDLRDRFIVGARQDDAGVPKTNVKGTLMQTGGEHEHTLTIAEMPSHSHTLPLRYIETTPGGPSAAEPYSPGILESDAAGGDQPHENCPPFYALAFIMKL